MCAGKTIHAGQAERSEQGALARGAFLFPDRLGSAPALLSFDCESGGSGFVSTPTCSRSARSLKKEETSAGGSRIERERERENPPILTAVKNASSRFSLVFALVSTNAHPPNRCANCSPCLVSTSRSWTRSTLFPTRTTGTVSESLTRATWVRNFSTRSNEAREVTE